MTVNEERVQPCADCSMETVPRTRDGDPLRGKCEYYMVTTAWHEATAKDGARFLCIGCLEKRLGRKLKWWDFVILAGEAAKGEGEAKRYFQDVSVFDSPRLRDRKRPGPSRWQQKKDGITITRVTLEDFLNSGDVRKF